MAEKPTNDAMRSFLMAINAAGDNGADSWQLPGLSPAQEGARAKCKARGLATFDRKAWRWFITPSGRAALENGG